MYIAPGFPRGHHGTGGRTGQKSLPGFRKSQLKGQKKYIHIPVTSLSWVDDFCLVPPSVFHKTLEDSQDLWVLIQGAACRGDA